MWTKQNASAAQVPPRATNLDHVLNSDNPGGLAHHQLPLGIPWLQHLTPGDA